MRKIIEDESFVRNIQIPPTLQQLFIFSFDNIYVILNLIF